MNKVWKFFRLAAEEAVKNRAFHTRNHQLGCVAVRGDGAMVKASNGPTPVPTREMHAEYRVSKKMDYDATVYVVRVLKDGSYGMAMPCADCLKAMKSKRVKRIYFTIDNDNYGVIPLR